MWNIFKVYWICYNIASVLYFGFWLQDIGDLSSPTRDPTHTPCIGRWSLHHWTTREVPLLKIYYNLEKAMAPHSSTPAWKIPWAEEPDRLWSMGSLRVKYDWATSLSLLLSRIVRVFPGGASGIESACQCRRFKRCRFYPWVGKIPWRMAWQPTPVFLPGESHRQRSLLCYSP